MTSQHFVSEFRQLSAPLVSVHRDRQLVLVSDGRGSGLEVTSSHDDVLGVEGEVLVVGEDEGSFYGDGLQVFGG